MVGISHLKGCALQVRSYRFYLVKGIGFGTPRAATDEG